MRPYSIVAFAGMLTVFAAGTLTATKHIPEPFTGFHQQAVASLDAARTYSTEHAQGLQAFADLFGHEPADAIRDLMDTISRFDPRN